MSQLNIYPTQDLPEYLKWQILSFQRVEWPDGFEKENLRRDWVVSPDKHPTHLVIEENKLLISHAIIVWQLLTCQGEHYKSYGITGMFTFPSFRRQGHGLKIAKACKDYIEKSDADICMFFGVNNGLYEKAGFVPMPSIKISLGDKSNPKIIDKIPYMLFISDKGKKAKEKFEKIPVYFGEDVDL